MTRKTLGLTSLCLPLLVMAAPVAAELEFCNDTDLTAAVAIGYSSDGEWFSEGWWRIASGVCLSPVTEPLSNRYYYWRATNNNGAFAPDDYYFCTTESVFTIQGDTDCADRGFDRYPFREVDTGDALRFTVTLDLADAPDPVAPESPEAPIAERDEGDGQSRVVGEGLFSHCDAGDCLIVAEGRRVLVGAGRPQLYTLARNTPISFVGRMHSSEGSTDRIALSSFEERPPDAYGSVRAMLQGRWQALRSPSTIFEITGALRQDIILGTPVFEAVYDMVDQCPDGGAGDGPGVIFTYFSGGSDGVCWDIRVLEPDTLVVQEPGQTEETVFLRMN